MKVVILAGGYGTRISKESVTKPKPLVEIGGSRSCGTSSRMLLEGFWESGEAKWKVW